MNGPTLLLIATCAVGHAALFVWLVNVTHGSGLRWRHSDSALFVAIGPAAAGSIALLAWTLTHPIDAWPLPLRAYAALCAIVALIGMPFTCLRSVLRRLPPGVRGGKADNLLTASESAYVGTHRHAWMLRPRWNDSLRPQRLHWQVTLGSLPPALDGLSILHLSDLHMAPTYDQRFFAEVLQSCTADDFDLVLFTGDLVEHPDAIAWVEPMLSRLRGRLGQFAILGNHDLHYGEAAIRAAVVAAGFVDLDGRWQCVTDPVTGATIRLGGTSAPWGPALAAPVEADTAADLTIVLSHTPDQFPRIKRWGSADIVLCGHNHGGQIRLPLIGPVLMPSIYSRRFDQGFFQSDDTLMYVSRGLGAKFPLRWRCRPEITSFTIKSAREREAKTYRRAAEAIASQL